jgi:hypothetical protein
MPPYGSRRSLEFVIGPAVIKHTHTVLDSQTRGTRTRENRAPPCVTVPGSSHSLSKPGSDYVLGPLMVGIRSPDGLGNNNSEKEVCGRALHIERGTKRKQEELPT